jgi:hypothetical protein
MADFFTRMVAVNALGPNVAEVKIDVSTVWLCPNCGDRHDDESEAQGCCIPIASERFCCPVCNELHRDMDDARGCCRYGIGQPMQCPVCMKSAESFDVAADCCLHTHRTMTKYGREKIAELVCGGMPWAEAIAANVSH